MPTDVAAEPRTKATSALAAGLAILGVGFDVAMHAPIPALAQTVFVAVLAVALSYWVRGRARRSALAAAFLVSIFCSLRASVPLALLDTATIAAAFLAAVSPAVTDVFGVTIDALIAAVSDLVVTAIAAPAFAAAPIGPWIRKLRTHRMTPGLRTAAIAIPILAVFAVLLATADRVFATIITPDLPHLDVASLTLHIALIVVGAWIAATLWRSAMGPHPAVDVRSHETRSRLSVTEWITVLAGIDILFAIFVVVQFAFMFGGKVRVEVTPGLTYAQYARSGFFQLLAVAVLTVLVIAGVWDYGRRETARHRHAFLILVATMVVLSFVILVSAAMRLALYEDAFGFTMNRLIATVAIGWIGAVLAALVVLIATGARKRLMSALLVSALAAVVVFNLINPELFVAERNVARFRAHSKIDVDYLGRTLGGDAIPAAAGVLSSISDPAQRTALVGALCDARKALASDRGRDYNLGRRRARVALAGAGITEGTCRTFG